MHPRDNEVIEIIEESDHSETELLLPQETSDQSSIAMRIAQGSLGVVGLGAGILYIGPAEQCAKLDGCGKWLSDLTSQGVAIGVYTSGGADFALINMYMSANSIQRFFNYIKSQPTTGKQIGMSVAIITFAATQNIGLLLASLATSTATWQTVLTVSGGLPGSLFGAVGMIDEELTPLYHVVNDWRQQLMGFIHEHCSPNDPITQRYYARLHFYRVQQFHFLEQLNHRFNHIETLSSELAQHTHQNPLNFIFSNDIMPKEKSWLASGMRFFGNTTGLVFGTVISANFISNTYHILENYIENLPLRIASTIFLNTASTYGTTKVIMNGMSRFLETLSEIVSCEKTRSSIFQFRPKQTLLALGFAVLASSFSYAVADVIFTNEFKDKNDPARNALRIANIIGMNIFHLSGLFEFYKIAFSMLSRDDKAKFVFKVEKEVARLQAMSLDEFKNFVENNTDELNTLLSLHTYEEDSEHEYRSPGVINV